MEGIGKTRGPDQILEALRPFFALNITGATEDVVSVVTPVLTFADTLARRERRITFFGAFKAGKSTLLNAIIGVPLLPARSQRTTGVVTAVRYGASPSVSIVRRDGVEEEIPFDDAGAAITRNLTGNESGGIEEVRIAVPLPLLANRCALVDTPGLLDDEILSGIARREIERTDLAVMVLSADKILSSAEREAARRAHELLHGNVVFVVNRLDVVDEEDREEVLDWAGDALRGSGNALVGMPRIFATSARTGAGGPNTGLVELERWLGETFASNLGEEIAAVSRLGILEHHLASAHGHLHARLDEARSALEQARQDEATDLAREKARIRGDLAQGRVRVGRVRDGLDDLGNVFVTGCVEDTRREMKGPIRLSGPIPIRFEHARDRYAATLSDEVRDALAGLPVRADPDFDLGSWIFRAHVDPASHPASDIGVTLGDLATRVVDGGSAGREAGANLGAWIGKNVFHVDVEQETVKRVERVARASATSLQDEAERYLQRIEARLDEADRFYESWTRAAPRVAAAEKPEGYYRGLTVWVDAFLREVRTLSESCLRMSTM